MQSYNERDSADYMTGVTCIPVTPQSHKLIILLSYSTCFTALLSCIVDTNRPVAWVTAARMDHNHYVTSEYSPLYCRKINAILIQNRSRR